MESIKSVYKIGHGPSSSHTMGPEKACLYVLDNYKRVDRIEVTLYGSLALTGKGHLTDKIIKDTLKDKKVNITFDYKEKVNHPNSMKFELYENNKLIDTLFIVSIGGGNIEINGSKVNEADTYPFNNFQEIKDYCINNNCSLADVVYKYEDNNIKDYLLKVYNTMKDAISRGLVTEGELPGGLHVIRKAKQLHSYIEKEDKKIQIVSSYAFATSEENASGGLIVTAPTSGSCGVVPASLFYLEETKNIPVSKMLDGLAVAGLIGSIIKKNASVAGALAGCQSEIGSACTMASAAISYLNGLSLEEIEYSAEIALEHHLGLTCDPVNGLVQIPCIERNAVAALRAIDASSIAKYLNGTRKVSLDTVIKTMYETGKDLKKEYKETAIGGLAKNYVGK